MHAIEEEPREWKEEEEQEVEEQVEEEQEEVEEDEKRKTRRRCNGFSFQIEFAMNFCVCIFV